MALNMELLRKRLREAFEKDSQEVIGRKLNMTQGNVSKLLSGQQQPSLETIYNISEVYHVSVDRLLGLTEKKIKTKFSGQITYKEAVDTVMALMQYGGEITCDQSTSQVAISSDDLLLSMLVNKAKAISAIDSEMYRNWRNEKLVLFEDKLLLDHDVWRHDAVYFLSSQASSESDWIKVYEKALVVQRDLEENAIYYSPFS